MKSFLIKGLKRISYTVSFIAVVFVLLAFTQLPYWAYYNLAVTKDGLKENPDYIVVMGGDGMPSPSGLMRLYFGIEKAKIYSDSKIILALPYNQFDSTYQLNLMAHEMVQKGIDTNRILFEPNGFNTRSQVEYIEKMVDKKSQALLIVTSPEHMFRCLASFRKYGFEKVGGTPTFETPSDEEMLKDRSKSKDGRVKHLALRYNMWSYMQYEIIVMREYAAICYYWFKGWI